MTIPPTLSERMRNSSFSIKGWIGVDKIQSDCKTANVYMDEGIIEKQRIKRNVIVHKYDIFGYLNSCKKASQRELNKVSPSIKKWCYYRSTDPRLEELWSE